MSPFFLCDRFSSLLVYVCFASISAGLVPVQFQMLLFSALRINTYYCIRSMEILSKRKRMKKRTKIEEIGCSKWSKYTSQTYTCAVRCIWEREREIVRKRNDDDHPIPCLITIIQPIEHRITDNAKMEVKTFWPIPCNFLHVHVGSIVSFDFTCWIKVSQLW